MNIEKAINTIEIIRQKSAAPWATFDQLIEIIKSLKETKENRCIECGKILPPSYLPSFCRICIAENNSSNPNTTYICNNDLYLLKYQLRESQKRIEERDRQINHLIIRIIHLENIIKVNNIKLED